MPESHFQELPKFQLNRNVGPIGHRGVLAPNHVVMALDTGEGQNDMMNAMDLRVNLNLATLNPVVVSLNECNHVIQ